MIHRPASRSSLPRTVGLGGSLSLGILGLLLGACSADRPEVASANYASLQPDPTSTVSASTDDVEEPDSTREILVVELPFEEPDLPAPAGDDEISESPADAPAVEPVEADPEDTPDIPQVALGAGESAVCASVQIGRDAAQDGAEDRAADQRDLVLERAELVDDAKLADTLAAIDRTAPVEVAVLEAALDRCQDLGYRP